MDPCSLQGRTRRHTCGRKSRLGKLVAEHGVVSRFTPRRAAIPSPVAPMERVREWPALLGPESAAVALAPPSPRRNARSTRSPPAPSSRSRPLAGPEHPIPRFGAKAGVPAAEVALTPGTVTEVPVTLPAWPATAIERLTALTALLAQRAVTSAEAVAAFSGASAPLVQRHLDTLALMGEVARSDTGRYGLVRRAACGKHHPRTLGARRRQRLSRRLLRQRDGASERHRRLFRVRHPRLRERRARAPTEPA